ncbi:hypothetical protein [Serratia marcescens]|uniref:hypothetical protein n=1 Tax=Serratia marcescens TaxID=615 RepID=UPI000744DD50|nr:hypothetical protein [Serratia marcescens]CUY32077.1 Uncharacterised protein [Serratia marcescens]
MAKNEFKPFAIGEYANVLSQNEYESLPAVGAGFTSGVAKSEELNKVWRQSSVMSSVLGDFISINSGDDVLDDGDTSKVLQSLIKALSKPIINFSHPVGMVAWFAQNKNPNEIFPGTTWVYLGENKTIRLSKPDGSDLLESGGADQIIISKENLPNIALSVSGTANEVDLGSRQTDTQGRHNHRSGMAGPGASYQDYIVGSDNDSHRPLTYTSDDGEHAHTVNIGTHSHNVSGSTETLGSGNSINITNAYVKLMGWYRTA